MSNLIVDSQELKLLLIQRLKDLGLQLSTVCYREGINYKKIRTHYINQEIIKNEKTRVKVTQEEVLRICKAIGLNPMITVVKSKIEDVDIDKYKGLKLTNSNILKWKKEFQSKEN